MKLPDDETSGNFLCPEDQLFQSRNLIVYLICARHHNSCPISPASRFLQYIEEKQAKYASHFTVGRTNAFKNCWKCDRAVDSWQMSALLRKPPWWEMGETYVEDRYRFVLHPGMEPCNSDMHGSLINASGFPLKPKEISCVYKRSNRWKLLQASSINSIYSHTPIMPMYSVICYLTTEPPSLRPPPPLVQNPLAQLKTPPQQISPLTILHHHFPCSVESFWLAQDKVFQST